MKILLAGPGTGKTTKIKKMVEAQFPDAKKIQIISFTQATVESLRNDFRDNDNVTCSTLHSFAFGLNPNPSLYVLEEAFEEKTIQWLSGKLEIDFQTVCEHLNCITFDRMISSCVSFMKANPVLAETRIGGKLDLLIVDEFQDFSPPEQELVMLTAQFAADTIILGDDDQSIYGFKDADPEGIISLYNDESVEKIPHDNICYRCPDEVVDGCIKLLQQNKKRIQKEWKKSGRSGKLFFKQLLNRETSDTYVLDTIRSIRERDTNGSILILSPYGDVVKSLKSELTAQGIEIVDFWEASWDEEISVKIWWLNAIFSSSKLPFIVFLMKHYGTLGKANIIEFLKKSLEQGFEDVALTRHLILKLNALPSNLAMYLLTSPDMEKFFAKESDFASLREFIDDSSIESSLRRLGSKVKMRPEFEHGKVNIMSIHKAKGLQADYVFISGVAKGILPNAKRGLDNIEAQRRLLFVGMTRAKEELHVMYEVTWEASELFSNMADIAQFTKNTNNGKFIGQASNFVEEIIS